MKIIFKFLTVCFSIALMVCLISCNSNGKVTESESLSIEQCESTSDESLTEKTPETLVVESLIDGLPENDDITLNDKNAIINAENAFNLLSESQKSFVENYDKLYLAIQRIVFLSNVNSVDVAIAGIPAVDKITL